MQKYPNPERFESSNLASRLFRWQELLKVCQLVLVHCPLKRNNFNFVRGFNVSDPLSGAKSNIPIRIQCVWLCFRCSASISRVAAYNVLVELADGCIANFVELCKELVTMHHQPNPDLANEWEVCLPNIKVRSYLVFILLWKKIIAVTKSGIQFWWIWCRLVLWFVCLIVVKEKFI